MTEHTLKLTDADLSVIDQALQDAPFRHAYPVIQKINQQLAQARAAPSEAADD